MNICTQPEFLDLVAQTISGSRIAEEAAFTQHGNTSCLTHSLAVAYFSYRIARRYPWLGFNLCELVRGALLHDYFLYDWHTTPPPSFYRGLLRLHGFSHPYTAFSNAQFDFELSDREKDIITKHMFPLTFFLPLYRESWLVSAVDKFCSTYEVFSRNTYMIEEIQLASRLVLEGIPSVRMPL
ncbi:MAG: phosphohydrolase [Clostridia bacterium]|nr:phosphohydrolase [Clostridia bacterium]